MMAIFCNTIIILSVLAGLSCTFLTPVLELSQGKLRGLRGVEMNRYMSIPYATSERFQVRRTIAHTINLELLANRFSPVNCLESLVLEYLTGISQDN